MLKQEPPTQPPDPATSYERAKPEKEAGMGRLDAPKARPDNHADRIDQPVHKQESRQINAEDEVDETAAASSGAGALEQPDHSMHAEEPLGEDQAPMDIQDPQSKRHPRKEGKGGVP